jgi:hypothetical protein
MVKPYPLPLSLVFQSLSSRSGGTYLPLTRRENYGRKIMERSIKKKENRKQVICF